NSARDALVTVIDQLLIRNHPASPLRPAELSSRYDINRDRLVNATDVLLARIHATNPSTALRLIRAP
ncbi:MAG: dockerin type I domain-containing protein, partial [Planctomycetota bacterium]|nr:dockerin type I domain-containing protein [Planctomycetota bacterium]